MRLRLTPGGTAATIRSQPVAIQLKVREAFGEPRERRTAHGDDTVAHPAASLLKEAAARDPHEGVVVKGDANRRGARRLAHEHDDGALVVVLVVALLKSPRGVPCAADGLQRGPRALTDRLGECEDAAPRLT